MKLYSFLFYVICAMLPPLFFTSCQQGFRGATTSLASTSTDLRSQSRSEVRSSATSFINAFCRKNEDLLSKTQSKISRFREHAKVDISNLNDDSIVRINNEDFFDINITVNNTCLRQSKSGFSFDHFFEKRNDAMSIQTFGLQVPTSDDLDSLSVRILADDCVLRASGNTQLQFHSAENYDYTFSKPNDAFYDQMKHVSAIDLVGGFSHLYNPTLGMNPMSDTAKVVVGIVDTGIDITHRDLFGNLWSFSEGNDGPYYGVDAVSLDRSVQSYTDYNPQDEDGHGTHVAGLVAATVNNSVGVFGGSPYKTELMGVKVFRYNKEKGTYSASLTAVLNGARWARDNGAKILNISMGSNPIYGTASSDDWKILFDELVNDGVTVVLATGNGSGGVPATEIDNETFAILPAIYGAQFAGVINVGATQASNKLLASFSHYSSKYVEIVAPGTQANSGTLENGLISTVPSFSASYGSTGGYAASEGTSQAAPLVTGAVAQVYNYVYEKTGSYPSPCQAEAIIQFSAEKLDHLIEKVKDGNHLNYLNLGITLESLYNAEE